MHNDLDGLLEKPNLHLFDVSSYYYNSYDLITRIKVAFWI